MLLRVLFVLTLAIFGKSSFAGDFSYHCFTTIDCSNLFADIVTDKFTQRYPSSRFRIVAIAEFSPYSDGGGVGYAIAGVSPKEKTTQVPVRRFGVTERITNQSINGYEVTKRTEALLREAVANMMAACDRSPNCDVYTPQK